MHCEVIGPRPAGFFVACGGAAVHRPFSYGRTFGVDSCWMLLCPLSVVVVAVRLLLLEIVDRLLVIELVG